MPEQNLRRRVMGQLRTLVASLQTSARAIESNTGVTNAQLFLIRQLGDGEELSIGELALRMHARQNALSPVLKRLTEAGLIRRRTARDDGRRVLVSLTPIGNRLLQHAPPPPAERLVNRLQSLPPAQLKALATGLKALLVGIESSGSDDRLLFEERGR